jgi:hypothetical protein
MFFVPLFADHDWSWNTVLNFNLSTGDPSAQISWTKILFPCSRSTGLSFLLHGRKSNRCGPASLPFLDGNGSGDQTNEQSTAGGRSHEHRRLSERIPDRSWKLFPVLTWSCTTKGFRGQNSSKDASLWKPCLWRRTEVFLYFEKQRYRFPVRTRRGFMPRDLAAVNNHGRVSSWYI